MSPQSPLGVGVAQTQSMTSGPKQEMAHGRQTLTHLPHHPARQPEELFLLDTERSRDQPPSPQTSSKPKPGNGGSVGPISCCCLHSCRVPMWWCLGRACGRGGQLRVLGCVTLGRASTISNSARVLLWLYRNRHGAGAGEEAGPVHTGWQWGSLCYQGSPGARACGNQCCHLIFVNSAVSE